MERCTTGCREWGDPEGEKRRRRSNLGIVIPGQMRVRVEVGCGLGKAKGVEHCFLPGREKRINMLRMA